MALINCPNCGKPCSDRAERCPHCGCPVREVRTRGSGQQTTPPPRKSNKAAWIAVCLVAVCVIGIIIAARFLHGGNTKTAVRESSATYSQVDESSEISETAEQAEEQAAEVTEQAEEQEPKAETINGHEYVDMGLSVKWATCNVGASSPEGYGNYYAWGETSTKSSYTSDNSKTSGKDIGSIAGNPSYDAARANWGGSWRLPTADEINELEDKCQWTWTTAGGYNGYKVTGPSGNILFLPAAGSRNGTSLGGAGDCGYYWSATPYDSDTANTLFFIGYLSWGIYDRYLGFSVRAVSD